MTHFKHYAVLAASAPDEVETLSVRSGSLEEAEYDISLYSEKGAVHGAVMSFSSWVYGTRYLENFRNRLDETLKARESSYRWCRFNREAKCVDPELAYEAQFVTVFRRQKYYMDAFGIMLFIPEEPTCGFPPWKIRVDMTPAQYHNNCVYRLREAEENGEVDGTKWRERLHHFMVHSDDDMEQLDRESKTTALQSSFRPTRLRLHQ